MAVSFARVVSTKRNTLAACLLAALATSAGASQMADAVSAGAVKAHRSDSTASVIPVTSCADDGSDGTLRKAIEGAGDGDTIDLSGLACSLITLQSGELVSALPHLTLKGPGIDLLTIDGDNSSRVLRGKHLDVSDLTIAHGFLLSTEGGGCVLADGDLSLTRTKVAACISISGTLSTSGGAARVIGKLTMRDSAIVGSTASGYTVSAGGGAFVTSAALYNSTISDNTVQTSQGDVFGGGLAAFGNVELHASTIGGNTATTINGRAYGGGIHAQHGVTTFDISILDASTVSGNTAHSDLNGGYGGGVNSGVYTNPYVALVKVEHSTISGNAVDSNCAQCVVTGGGAHAFHSVTAKYSTINDNDATCDDPMSSCNATGGGLSSSGVLPSSRTTLWNATVSANSAVGGAGAFGSVGGGVHVRSDRQLVAHTSTIAFNHASHFAGGIAATSPAITASDLNGTIVANNDTDAGPDDIAPSSFGATLTITGAANLVMNASAAVTLPAGTLTTDPQLQPLTTDEGGLTAVHPLPVGSAAIDAGNNVDLLGCDQRGYPYHRVAGTAPDIGAYEEQGEAHLFADAFDGFAVCPPAAP